MTLSNIDHLSPRLKPKPAESAEVDPDRRGSARRQPRPLRTCQSKAATVSDPLVIHAVRCRRFRLSRLSNRTQDDDAHAFGASAAGRRSFKLDATVDRRLLRQQRDRLGPWARVRAALFPGTGISPPPDPSVASRDVPTTAGYFPVGGVLRLFFTEELPWAGYFSRQTRDNIFIVQYR